MYHVGRSSIAVIASMSVSACAPFTMVVPASRPMTTERPVLVTVETVEVVPVVADLMTKREPSQRHVPFELSFSVTFDATAFRFDAPVRTTPVTLTTEPSIVTSKAPLSMLWNLEIS